MYRVLVANDDAFMCHYIKKSLADKNIDVFTCGNGIEAIDMAFSKNYDLIILDIFMPGKDGLEVCKELKANIKTKDIPVIFVTSKTDVKGKIEGFQLGADDYIIKPFEQEELYVRVKAVLEKSKKIERLTEEIVELKTLVEISKLPYITLKINEIAPMLLSIVVNYLQADGAALFLYDHIKGVNLLSSHGSIASAIINNISSFTVDEVISRGEPLLIKDPQEVTSFRSLKPEQKELFQSLISYPIKRKNISFAVMEIYRQPGKPSFTEKILEKMRWVAEQASIVMHLSLLFAEVNENLQQAIKELATLYNVSIAFSSTLDLDELLRLIVKNAKETLAADVVSLMMLDPKTQELTIKIAEGLPQDIVANTSMKLGEGIAGRVAQEGQPLLLVDIPDEESLLEIERGVKSALSVPLLIKGGVKGVLNVSKTSPHNYHEGDLQTLFNLGILAAQAIEKAELYENIKNSYEELQTTYMNTVSALSMAIEAKDFYTRGHIDRVTKYGLAIAMELDPELVNDDMFRYALVLHDIGKIEIPDHILNKPSSLTAEEYEIVKRHPVVGAQILAPIKFLEQAMLAVKYHQERYDGKGYPEGLKGEDIPITARIIAVADAFDAMISDRPYRKAMSVDQAQEEILRNSGTQFDPMVVNAFISALRKGLIP